VMSSVGIEFGRCLSRFHHQRLCMLGLFTNDVASRQ
jgi:hypothetical protein